jgi:hypothetical protein
MAGFDQAARLDFDWDNATVVDNVVEDVKLNAPVVTAVKNKANNGEEVEISITSDNENTKIYYTTDGTMPTVNSEEYKGSFKISDSDKTIVVNAIAINGDDKSEIGTTQVKFENSSTSSDSSDKIEDGKYWMNVNLWNANTDQESMGDSAFNNNRQALVTVSGNTATIEIATNPVSVSGYTSAVKDIKSSDVTISVDGTSKFTTNTRYDGTEHEFDYITKFSFDLDELKKEYIDVEINVPYTPMDGIVAGANSYIPARLKLNWSSLEEAGANDKLTADTSVATGSTSSGGGGGVTSFVNNETGIKVEAEAYVLPDDVEFETKTLTAGTAYSTANGLIDGDFVLYSIKANSKSEGGEVSPVGVANVYIPVNIDGTNVKIYRFVEGDKNTKSGLTEMEYKLSNDGKYYIVTVKEFGLFAVVNGEKTEDIETAEAFAQGKIVTADGKEINFDDISEHWAKDYIVKSAKLGLFSGIEENKFGPNTNTTRAMFVTVLGRLANAENSKNTNISFDDVQETDYFFNYVQWAVENGIVSGISENLFAPNTNITREQTAVILYNFAKNQGIELKNVYNADFSDNKNISSWAEVGVNALAKAGVIMGRSDGTFDPKGTATRAEIATMLVKFVDEYMISEIVEEEAITEETKTAVENTEVTK